MEYLLISASYQERHVEFAARINKKLAEGWELYGSPFYSYAGGEVHQAMIFPRSQD